MAPLLTFDNDTKQLICTIGLISSEIGWDFSFLLSPNNNFSPLLCFLWASASDGLARNVTLRRHSLKRCYQASKLGYHTCVWNNALALNRHMMQKKKGFVHICKFREYIIFWQVVCNIYTDTFLSTVNLSAMLGLCSRLFDFSRNDLFVNIYWRDDSSKYNFHVTILERDLCRAASWYLETEIPINKFKLVRSLFPSVTSRTSLPCARAE